MKKESLSGWRMYLSGYYWLMKFRFWIAGTPPLHIVEVFVISDVTEEAIMEGEQDNGISNR